jgi:hypothetical protein
MVRGKQAGTVTAYDTLSFVRVFQAVSHGCRSLLGPHGSPRG